MLAYGQVGLQIHTRLGESKVPSPLTAAALPAGCQRVGHTHAFGSTEEPLRRTVFGCRERGPASGPAFSRATGQGHVPFFKGDYHDALRRKNNQVALLLVEALGGVASGGAPACSVSSPGAPRTRSAAGTAPSTASSTRLTTSPTT